MRIYKLKDTVNSDDIFETVDIDSPLLEKDLKNSFLPLSTVVEIIQNYNEILYNNNINKDESKH